LSDEAHDPLRDGAGAPMNRGFVFIGGGLLLLAALLAVGASQITGNAGYAGAGPAFLPWTVAAVLAGLGATIIALALRHRGPIVAAPDFPPHWKPLLWVSVGLLLNASLIEYIGFIPSCALLFAFAARGFRLGADQAPSWGVTGRDLVIGAVVSAPVFWLFTKLLGISLPSLLGGGWL